VYSKEIAEDEIVIISSDDHPLAKKQRLSVNDIVTQPFIMPETGSGLRECIDDFLSDMNVDLQNIRVVMTLGNPELIVQMVQSGIGISLVSKWSVFRAVKDESIRLLTVSNRKLRRKFYLTCLEEEPPTMAAKTFLEFVRGYQFFIPL
jgi:DNA-binding transcriptional LysR family regulator